MFKHHNMSHWLTLTCIRFIDGGVRRSKFFATERVVPIHHVPFDAIFATGGLFECPRYVVTGAGSFDFDVERVAVGGCSARRLLTQLLGGPNGICKRFPEIVSLNWKNLWFRSRLSHVDNRDSDVWFPLYSSLLDSPYLFCTLSQ